MKTLFFSCLVTVGLHSSLGAVPAALQAVQLNEALAQTWAARAGPFEIALGGRVVYALSPSLTAPFGLRAAPLDGSQPPTQLSPPPMFGETVQSLRLTAAGTRVVYLTDTEGEGALYSVPVDGSQSAVQISHSHAFGIAIEPFYLISPDSSRVVYLAFEGFSPENKIYSAPIAGGGAAIELSAPLPDEEIVMRTFAIGAAGNRVVFVVRNVSLSADMYSIAADGSGALVRLNPPMPAGRDILQNFQLSPDGSVAFYVADQDTDNVFELYRVPCDGSAAAVKLSETLVAGGDVALVSGLQISPDGLRAVYTADGAVDGRVELYSVPTDASAAPIRLNGALVAGGNVTSGFQISPDGSRATYLADQNVDGMLELFSVPIDGSAAAVRLNGPLGPGGRVSNQSGGFSISGDSARVVYLADATSDEVDELFSVPLDASQPAVKLNPALVAGGDVRLARIAPDSSRVAFVADASADEEFRVHVVPLDGGAPAVELAVPACGASAGALAFDASSARLLFTASFAGTVPPVELFSAPSDGSQVAVSLDSAPEHFAVSGDVLDVAVSPDGHQVVYSAAVERFSCAEPRLLGTSLDGPFTSRLLAAGASAPSPRLVTGENRVLYTASPDGLYSVPLEGGPPSGSAPLLLAPLAAQAELESLTLAPDGVTALFIGRETAGAGFELHAVRTDTALSSSTLSAPLVANGRVRDYQVDPAGRFAVYRADQRFDEVFELFSSPLDRSRPSRRISGPLTPGGDVLASAPALRSWRISPDGARVVYLADARTDGVIELFSVGLDSAPYVRRPGAPRPLVRLARTLVSGGNVMDFRIAPDGATVVYLADQEVNQRFELYRVPIDGRTPPVKLSSALTTGGNVQTGFEISPDGARVLYLADQAVDNRVELWSVPLTGGTAVVLNAPLIGPRDVTSFQIAPDSTRAVYLGQQTSARPELFSALLDGSGAPVQLNTPLPSARSITEFRIAARGGAVVYLSDQATDEVFELFAASLDGTRSPFRVNGTLTPNGDVVAFVLTPDGKRVVYRADQAADERYELFQGYLSPPYRRSP